MTKTAAFAAFIAVVFLFFSVRAFSAEDSSQKLQERFSSSDLIYRLDGQSQELRAIAGFQTPSQSGRDAEEVAVEFLNQNSDLFFNAGAGRGYQVMGRGASSAPSGQGPVLGLELEREHEGSGKRHLLFRPILMGVPVEFSRISVHMNQNNSVTAALSGLEGSLSGISPVPAVSESQALAKAQEWAHGRVPPETKGELVYLPARFEAETRPFSAGAPPAQAHLAWKFQFRLSQPFGLWSVYVDAHSGEFLGAVNELRQGDVAIQSAHWCRDPAGDCDTASAVTTWSTSSIRGVVAWERDTGAGTLVSLVDSDRDGDVAHSDALSLFAMLRTTYAVIVDELGSNPTFAEGFPGSSSAAWTNLVISSASSSPYGLSVSESQTFSCPAGTVFSIPRFSSFDVGMINTASDFTTGADDLDLVEILDGTGGPALASYAGANRTAFNAIPSTGTSAVVRLRSNAVNGAGNEGGYTVHIASCMRHLANAPGDPAGVIFSNSTGTSSSFALNNAFKHLETMHLYVSSAGSTGDYRISEALKTPVVAHVNFGSNFSNAFYDPDLDALYFGAGGNGNQGRNTALATDVIFHEYTHWVVDRIYNLPNFGHAGAVSEALADFFALDAFNDQYSSFGKTTFGEWAFPGQSRELNQSAKKTYPSNWTAEIHEDSLILSGALWDLRAAIGTYPARELAKAALFYFPDSFEGFFFSMLAASRDRFSGAHDSAIVTAFSGHGIGIWPMSSGGFSGDSQESNDGFATAKSLTSGTAVKPTIFPGGDVDYFRFASGAGTVKITLTRPFESESLLYLGYGFQVFDADRQLVASALPGTLFDSPTGNSVVSEQTITAQISLAAPKLLYVAVSAPLSSVGGNNDHTSSPSLAYTLHAAFPEPIGALTATRVSASISDQRKVRLSAVSSTGFDADQSTEATIDHVDVLDHKRVKLTDASGSNLTVTPITQTPGNLEAQVELPANFFTRYPSAGSIYMELFARNALGKVYSLGLSNEIKILSGATNLTAYNNLFNPLKGETAILKYESGAGGNYRLAVYTLAGDLVKILADRNETSGAASVSWDGRNGNGEVVASGVYLVHLEAPGGRKTQKVIVVK